MNLSVLIHTFNGYRHLWAGQWLAFCVHWDSDVPVFFGTDIKEDETICQYGNIIYSGQGEWTNRLQKLIEQIPTDYILYMQEDHWPKATPPKLSQMMGIVHAFNLNRLQLSPINQFYSLHGSEIPLFFHQKSKYLVSHQPSIWKKSFLLECLKPNETPWQNEYAGTMRLNVRDDIREKIAIYPCDWYKHMCIKGKMVEV